MRHLKAGRRLARTTEHRTAMLRNLITQLFEHERVQTTQAKAKEARMWAEKIRAERKWLHLYADKLPNLETAFRLQETVLRAMGYFPHSMIRPTAWAYRKRSMQLYQYAASSWRSMDTEHYSCCGYDDDQYERRRQARDDARVYMAAAILMENQGRRW